MCLISAARPSASSLIQQANRAPDFNSIAAHVLRYVHVTVPKSHYKYTVQLLNNQCLTVAAHVRALFCSRWSVN